jgi:glycosyltransferase involved in cell wall biosynthesis
VSGVRLENDPAAVAAPRSGNGSGPADSPLVLVLIPVLNPTPALVELARELLSTPPAALIVVDDGSGPGPDGIHDVLCEELRALGALVHRLPRNRGKGAALRAGIELAGRRFPGTPVVTADADGQHLPEDVRAVARAVPRAARVGVGRDHRVDDRE